MLGLERVTRHYAGGAALREVTLRFDDGVTTALIGASGSGKSTLLRVLAGVEPPDAGRLLVDGEPLAASMRLAHRRRIGYVIQEGGLFPHLTIAANASLLVRHLRWPRERIASRLREMAELTRFPSALLEAYPREISGGERQRAALLRALMPDPPTLLLDEPLGALDPLVRRDLQADLREIFRRLGKLVVFVTHDLAEAAFFADRLVLIDDGAVVQSGAPDDFLTRPASEFVRRFVRAQRVDWPPPA